MDTTATIRRPRPLARIGAALAAVLAVLLPGTPAWAHNALVDAQPAKGATLPASPDGVRLRFLQKLDPARTTIVVSDAAQQAVPAGKPSVEGKTGSLALTAPLPNGTYTVAYQVASTDGHTVKGSYRFTVADRRESAPAPAPPSALPSAAAALPTTTTTAAVPTAADEQGGGSSAPLLIGGAVLVAASAAVVVFRARRRPA